MAYKIDTKQKCQRCSKEGRYRVFNNLNAPDGYYCNYHADERVAELNRTERAPADD